MTMKDKRRHSPAERANVRNRDGWSQRLGIAVLLWILAVILIPLHGLLLVPLFFVDSLFPVVIWLLVFGVPLALIDIWAFNWARDSIQSYRWINDADDGSKRGLDGRTDQ